MEAGLRFAPATAETGALLERALRENGIAFRRVRGRIVIDGDESAAHALAILRAIQPADHVWFQPVVDTVVRQAIGMQCLMWPEGRRHQPGAETIQMRAACEREKTQKYFIGISPRTSADSIVASALRHGLDARYIVLEGDGGFTGSAHCRRLREDLARLRFRFALRHIHANADSLRRVCDLRPDYIKLDAALVAAVGEPMHATALRTLVDIADGFGARVVAEGVGRPGDMERLWRFGVQYMQGEAPGEACSIGRLCDAIAGPSGSAALLRHTESPAPIRARR